MCIFVCAPNKILPFIHVLSSMVSAHLLPVLFTSRAHCHRRLKLDEPAQHAHGSVVESGERAMNGTRVTRVQKLREWADPSRVAGLTRAMVKRPADMWAQLDYNSRSGV
jgi:hypothetical protein